MAAERQRISKRFIDSLVASGMDRMLWDCDTLGFGLRVSAVGRITYILQYRIEGRQRRFKIGTHGSPWTPELARQEAKRLLGCVATGDDPQRVKFDERSELSVAQVCELYLAEGLLTRKPTSIASARADIEHHIKPLLGMHRVSSLTRAYREGLLRDVAAGKTVRTVKQGPRRLARVRGGKGAANSTLTTMSAALGFAVARKLRADNPAIGIRKFPSRKIERFLSPVELARLGQVLAGAASLGVESPLRACRDPTADADRVPQERDPHAKARPCRSLSPPSKASRQHDGIEDRAHGHGRYACDRGHPGGCR